MRKPLTEDAVMMHIAISKELLVREQRRYFRHPVNLPLPLKEGEFEQQARITNLSGGGMAVRTAKPLKHGAVLDLTFELSMGLRISARGQVAWVNPEGMAEITLQTLRGKGSEQLDTWLAAREKLHLEGKPPEA
ncbi:MAG: hypothetical protein DMG38_12395 [Acidobacteria bacterium]|nr:MAG: hypothetical protein DMG38_12395 [Acidobacteriota bacterium]